MHRYDLNPTFFIFVLAILIIMTYFVFIKRFGEDKFPSEVSLEDLYKIRQWQALLKIAIGLLVLVMVKILT